MGIFSRSCYIKELYSDLCFCVNSDLPETVISKKIVVNFFFFKYVVFILD